MAVTLAIPIPNEGGLDYYTNDGSIVLEYRNFRDYSES